MKKKLFALALAACMTLSLAACGSSSAPSTAAASAAASAATSGSAATSAASTSAGKTYTVGICQLVQHPALDAATEGFEAALKEQVTGDAVTFDFRAERRRRHCPPAPPSAPASPPAMWI
jgi:putative ABC transport system substrate-binding protein